MSIKNLFLLSKLTLLCLVVMNLSSCVKNEQSFGYTIKDSVVSELEVGKTRKAVVQRKLGTPSSESDYGSDIWYYISTEEERVAFFKPKVKKQTVLAIEFSPDQTIKNIHKYSAADVQNIELRNDITKTEGNDLSVLQQLLGNVGRFNPDIKKK